MTRACHTGSRPNGCACPPPCRLSPCMKIACDHDFDHPRAVGHSPMPTAIGRSFEWGCQLHLGFVSNHHGWCSCDPEGCISRMLMLSWIAQLASAQAHHSFASNRAVSGEFLREKVLASLQPSESGQNTSEASHSWVCGDLDGFFRAVLAGVQHLRPCRWLSCG